MRIHHTELEVVPGSVLEQDVEAIVNAANTAMRGGGGVDGAIHRAAGSGLLEELKRVAPNGAPTGTAVLTSGHNLKQRYIIHTPGPVWRGGTHGEPELLAACYRSCMELAHQHNLESLAFCSISTGVYGYPLEQAAPIALKTVCGFLESHPDTSLRRVVFAM
ncbi:MAG: macro domain-containing protein, partial [Armatimonadota bacterium]|nr:macro domain-containing protein [Armatimonadota bacterium]